MKLSKLKLWNYRCFGSEEQVILIDQLTTFIGNNSAGKTAALSALNCMFSENSNDRILHRSDFHLPKDILPDEMEQQSLCYKIFCENWQNPVKQRITPHFLTTSPSNYYEFTTKE